MNAWLRLLWFRLQSRGESVVLRDGRSLGLLSVLAALVAVGGLFSLVLSIALDQEDESAINTAFHASSPLATGKEPGFQDGDVFVSIGRPGDPEGWWTDEKAGMALESGVLPGEDGSFASFARRVDAALLQTLSRRGLSTSAVARLESEARLAPDGMSYYSFVRLVIQPEIPGFNALTPARRKAEATSFAAVLRDSLKIWEPKARLRKEGDTLFFVTVGNLVTHSVRYGESGENSLVGSLPAEGDTRPVLTIIMDDMGENLSAARKLLALPYPVTLSIWPHSAYAGYTATLARERGRQVFVHHPLEPVNFERRRDIIRTTLKASSSSAVMAASLKTALSMVPYAAGINNHMGSKFTSDKGAVARYCLELKRLRSDLIVVDSLTHEGSLFYDEARKQGFSVYRRALFLDDEKEGRAEVLKELDKALALARKHGHAVVIGHPRAGTLAALAAWKGYSAKDVRIAPLVPTTINRGLSPQDSEQP